MPARPDPAPGGPAAPAIAAAVNPWYRANARPLPWREPGFSAWGTLVSEFMLQQTQVERVIPRLERWLERWPDPAALAADPPGEAVRAWDRLGYPRRALWLHRAAEQIAREHGNRVPEDVDALLALTGVGDYTARAVAVFAYGRRHPVVDTNTRRVLARAVHGLAAAGVPRPGDLDDMAAQLPADEAEAAVTNAALMELGQTVCTPKKPGCPACPLAGLCEWRGAGFPDNAPKAPAKQARFAGSDREARGLILAVARAASAPTPRAELLAAVPEPERGERALASLLTDGLLAPAPGGLALP